MEWPAVSQSPFAANTSNPIRKILEVITSRGPNPVYLSIGDPTKYGNFPPPSSAIESVKSILVGSKSNGYAPSCGIPATRSAIAEWFQTVADASHVKIDASDVFLASGASGALQMCIEVLAGPGDNILLPRPGFGLYRTLAESKSIQWKYYDLLPDKAWSIDLDHLRSLADERTKAILINNPSNPCGSVFTRKHLCEIVALADELKIPIISDEIYAEMAFEPHEFHSIMEISDKVPCLVAGGTAKRFMVPGWRVGWTILHDPTPTKAFDEIRQGLFALSTQLLGPNTLIQAAVPRILTETPPDYFTGNNRRLQANAEYCMERCSKIRGLTPIEPQGAMYMMIRVDSEQFDSVISDDITFFQNLLSEEGVEVLPGSCFAYPQFFRVVLCVTPEILHDAWDRIEKFCTRHLKAHENGQEDDGENGEPASKRRKTHE
eukprot:c46144_g1_i1.p1 GENE.c46144_g1_i1~~c46144_g1_i1.p1  ORF type:complete len:451 (+),score=79.60 c46144_g1_i1:54-1355(+)